MAGPVHSLTDRYRDYAEAMAKAAEAKGMEVHRIFHPNATKERVIEHANGADLFIYVGPRQRLAQLLRLVPGVIQERPRPRTRTTPRSAPPSNVLYKGADWLRENIVFAPNAVVILSHLSYASGNASSGMTIPSRDVAVQRIDNYANGFLAAGARVVWALGWQPGADVIDALFSEDATMDAVFLTRYREGVGPNDRLDRCRPRLLRLEPHPRRPHPHRPGPRARVPARHHRRPRRSRRPRGAPPGAAAARHGAARRSARWPSARPPRRSPPTDAPPVFTPNGDGVSDTVRISHLLSEDAFLHIRVRRGRQARPRA